MAPDTCVIATIAVSTGDVEAIEAMLDADGEPPLLVVADGASDGRALLADLIAGHGAVPRLLVIDARLPAEARLDLLTRLRGSPRLGAVPVLVLGGADAGGLRALPDVTPLPRPTSFPAFEHMAQAIRRALAQPA